MRTKYLWNLTVGGIKMTLVSDSKEMSGALWDAESGLKEQAKDEEKAKFLEDRGVEREADFTPEDQEILNKRLEEVPPPDITGMTYAGTAFSRW